MATASNPTVDSYTYMDEANIDSELKCVICMQPFQEPVSSSCQHTFCRSCIESCLKRSPSCPICRSSVGKVRPPNTSIVKSQLNQLLVRCNHCGETNIQRGNFPAHERRCPKQIVLCLSADIQCPWQGPRDQYDTHLQTCSFHQIRPIIDHLQEKLDKQSQQIEFLLAFINQGKPMNTKCLKSYNRQECSADQKHKLKIEFHCTLCEKAVRKKHVSLHACSSDKNIDCICDTCYERQYPVPEDTEDEDASNDEDTSDDD